MKTLRIVLIQRGYGREILYGGFVTETGERVMFDEPLVGETERELSCQIAKI